MHDVLCTMQFKRIAASGYPGDHWDLVSIFLPRWALLVVQNLPKWVATGNCPKKYTRVLPRCPNRNYDRHDFLLVLGGTIRIDLMDKDPDRVISIQLFIQQTQDSLGHAD